MTEILGVDFSAHPPGHPGSAELKAAGKFFVCTYLGHAQDWRVMTPGEIAELRANGVDVVANYEADVETWRGGFATGVDHARYAQEHLVRLGLPATQPIYFSVDYDASPGDQAVIDDYLRGCASIIGLDRTGIYGGFYVVRRCHDNGTVAYLWQTSAWSGGQWFEGNHLEQYAYGVDINSVECDLTRAVKEHYGQASDFLPHPTTTTTPHPVLPPKLPKGMSAGVATRLFNPRKIVNPETGKPLKFARGANVTEAWIAHGISTIPVGGTWKDGRWPELTRVVVRGDGRRDWIFSDGWVCEQGGDPSRPLGS